MEPEVIEEEVSLFEDGGEKTTESPEPKQADPSQDDKPKFEVPDKFKDKSFEDVVESYINLEKMNGNMANEVGDLRKLTDQILLNQAQQSVQRVPEAEDVNDDVGLDDFIDDPAAAVNAALAQNPTIKRLEQTIEKNEQDASRSALLARHADADTLVASPEFQAWLNESPGRRAMLQSAHVNRNVDVAIDMLDMYKATKQATNEEAVAERDARAKGDLKKAAVESGGSPSTTRKVYRRSELIELKLRDPARYEAMRDEIHAAYAEGRVK
jgi:hypothetical protein